MFFDFATQVDAIVLVGMGSLVLSLVFSSLSLARAAVVNGRKKS